MNREYLSLVVNHNAGCNSTSTRWSIRRVYSSATTDSRARAIAAANLTLEPFQCCKQRRVGVVDRIDSCRRRIPIDSVATRSGGDNHSPLHLRDRFRSGDLTVVRWSEYRDRTDAIDHAFHAMFQLARADRVPKVRPTLANPG